MHISKVSSYSQKWWHMDRWMSG